MTDISVVIVNWNSKDFVRRCLASLAKHPATSGLEVVVVDSGSFDGCGEMLASEYPATVFVQMNENVGFGRANNAGIKRTKNPILWLLNPDTEVLGDACTMLYRALGEVDGAGIVGAKLLNSDGSLQTTCVQSLPTVMNQALGSDFLRRLFPGSRLWGISALKSTSDPVEVEAVPGACVMIRREIFDKVGRFDPGYFMYGEDMDLCFKVREAGLSVIYVPRAEVLHHGGGSSRKQFSKFSVVLMRESVAFYLARHFGPYRVGLYRLCMGLSALARVAFLSAARLVTGGASHERNLISLQKWTAILRWCLGGERWARGYSQNH